MLEKYIIEETEDSKWSNKGDYNRFQSCTKGINVQVSDISYFSYESFEEE
jgi:hypothetical protein